MGIFGFMNKERPAPHIKAQVTETFSEANLKAGPKTPRPTAADNIGDVYLSPNPSEAGIFKAYIPEYLYKPPFGYPRKENLPLIRQLAANPYVFPVINTIANELAMADWEIAYKRKSKKKGQLDDLQESITGFFENPNQNKDGFFDLRKAWARDVLEVDAGVFEKIFNLKQEFVQMFARDGASFLKNPDIHGYMGNRQDFVEAMDASYQWMEEDREYRENAIKQYNLSYGEYAAYYQYGNAVSASLPVPFGRREIIYSMLNPRTDSPYGRSPVQILADVITTLVYGANYNLDFYLNNNMPEGIVQLLNAQKQEIKAFRARLEQTYRVEDKNTGFMRRMAFRVPIVNREAAFIPFQLDPKTMQVLEQQSWFWKLVMACFGVTPDEMGITEDSNRAVSQVQERINIRKALRPIMKKFEYEMNMQVISEWGIDAYENLEFKFIEHDLETDIKRMELNKLYVDMGIKSRRMVAEEEGIEYEDVLKDNQEDQERNVALQTKLFGSPNPQQDGNNQDDGNDDQGQGNGQPGESKQQKARREFYKSLKGQKPDNEIEAAMRQKIKEAGKRISEALDRADNRPLDAIA